MSFYQLNLAAFATGNALLLYRQYQTEKRSKHSTQPDSADNEGGRSSEAAADVKKFKTDFFLVYALVVAADWLQGPHIYAIYKYDKGIPERMVAALYASGFVSGAVSASFAGQLADRYGRRRACLLYCLFYLLTCLSMLSNSFPVLLFGRLCGGVSTTLLFSVFETWMIAEYHSRGLEQLGLTLSSVFGHMTTLSCIVAIASGVLGDVLVVQLGDRIWPFVASMACSLTAAFYIWTTWVRPPRNPFPRFASAN